MGQTKGKTKKLPPKTEVDTTVFIKKKGTRKRWGSIKIGQSTDSAETYYNEHGVVPRKQDSNSWTDVLEGLSERAENMEAMLNSNKNDENIIYTQTFASPDEEDFNVVFSKFREFLNDNKVEIMGQLKLTANITSAYLNEDPAINHKYLIDDANSEADEESMTFFEQNYDLIVGFLTDPLASPSGFSFSYDVANPVVSDDKNAWTAGDMQILQDTKNRENAYYVIGQVFNIIDPTFNGNFVVENFNKKLDLQKEFVEILTKDIPKFFGFINAVPASPSP
jgi:hypothetical protein